MLATATSDRVLRREASGRDPGDPFPADPDDARAEWDGNDSRAIRSLAGRGQRTPPTRLPAWHPVGSRMRRP
jgi:hypothetical protein